MNPLPLPTTPVDALFFQDPPLGIVDGRLHAVAPTGESMSKGHVDQPLRTGSFQYAYIVLACLTLRAKLSRMECLPGEPVDFWSRRVSRYLSNTCNARALDSIALRCPCSRVCNHKLPERFNHNEQANQAQVFHPWKVTFSQPSFSPNKSTTSEKSFPRSTGRRGQQA